MFGKRITLFKLLGFSVRIDMSWLIILAIVVWSLAGSVFPEEYEGLHWSLYVAMGLGGAIGLFLSIVLHELSHSLVARRYGLPMKGITLFLFGGVAEMTDEPPSPKAEFFMAIAGPAFSFVFAAVCIGISVLGRAQGWPVVVTGIFQWLGLINAILAVFNLVPGFPLDGGRVLRSILWRVKKDFRAASRIAAQSGRIVGMILIGLGFLSLLFGNAFGGLWWILIGLFLRWAAQQSYQQVLVREALRGEPVRRFMSKEPVTAPASVSIQELVEDYIYEYHHKMFPVVEDGRLLGCITTRHVKNVPRDMWAQRQVGEVVSPCSDENTIAPNEDAMKVLSRMHETRSGRLMVVEDDKLVGILALKDLLKFLALKLELESGEAGSVRLPHVSPRQ